MATDASVALGSPQVAGIFVNPTGFARRAVAMSVGGVVGSAIAAGTAPKQTGAPAFGRVGFLAATDSEIALVKTKSGLIGMKVTDQVLARRERSEIASIQIDGGALASRLTVQFTDGDEWLFDVPRAKARDARQFVETLGVAAV
ncbi:MAG TPA: hypothetical protein VHV31_14655 [Nitrolancea sp.]|nr:hypothetical protein [Nitrolancea sp.]